MTGFPWGAEGNPPRHHVPAMSRDIESREAGIIVDERVSTTAPSGEAAKRAVSACLRILPLVGALAGVFLVAGVHWRFGPVCRLVARLSGQEIWFESPTIDLGLRPAGTVVSKSVAIRNLSDHPIEVLGVNVSCGCTKVSGVPCTIPEADTARFPLEITIAREKARVREEAVFIINERGNIKKYHVAIRGEAAPPANHGSSD